MIQQIADLWVKKPPHLFSSGQTLCCAPPMVPEKRVINKKLSVTRSWCTKLQNLELLPICYIISHESSPVQSINVMVMKLQISASHSQPCF